MAQIKKYLHSINADPSLLKNNGTVTLSSDIGSLWAFYSENGQFPFVTIGSYTGAIFDGEYTQTIIDIPEDFEGDSLALLAQVEEETKAIKKQADEEKKIKNESTAISAKGLIAEIKKLKNTENSPYLTRKQLPTRDDVFVDRNLVLYIPMVGEKEEIVNVQRIYPNGDKYMLEGGKVSGTYHTVSRSNSNTMLVAEGYSTALSVCLALESKGKKANVVCAFNSGNLKKAIDALRKLHPKKTFIILADNDQWKIENTGILSAQKCAVPFVNPEFDLSVESIKAAKPTDFNDLHVLCGLEEVATQVMAGLTELATKPKKLPRARTTVQDDEELTEFQVCSILKERMGDNIIACGEDFFIWNGKHWDFVEKGTHNTLLKIVSEIYGAEATHRKVTNTLNLFKIEVPQISNDIFKQKYDKCNFENGTLCFAEGRTWLKPFDKKDLITFTLPFSVPTKLVGEISGTLGFDSFVPDNIFHSLLRELLQGDKEKLQLVAEMYGALLFPQMPQVFFILGKPNTGKSTIAKIALNLVGLKNCSAVSPNKLFGFNLHSTLGKRVNYDLDIPTKRPIVDDVIKKVIDQVPIQLERKNRDSILAPLPPVHLFVGNELPDLFEGDASPMRRRVSFIHVVKNEVTNPDHELAQRCVAECFEDILQLAILGAKIVYQNKKYLQGEHKEKTLHEWHKNSSEGAVEFIDMLSHDGVPAYDEEGKFLGHYIVKGEGRVERSMLTNTARRYMGGAFKRNKFLAEILKQGYEEKLIEGRWYVYGLKCTAPEVSELV